MQLVGDDLLVTNTAGSRGIEEEAANSVLIKLSRSAP
jgi:enolase